VRKSVTARGDALGRVYRQPALMLVMGTAMCSINSVSREGKGVENDPVVWYSFLCSHSSLCDLKSQAFKSVLKKGLKPLVLWWIYAWGSVLRQTAMYLPQNSLSCFLHKDLVLAE
jgi:hypothetical protein